MSDNTSCQTKINKETVEKFILDSEDYPTMKELFDEFLVYSGNDIYFLQAVSELQQEGKILYDDKHDSWLYTGINNDKLRALVENSVRLSKNEV